MNKCSKFYLSRPILGVVLVFFASAAPAQQAGPTETKGLKTVKTTVIELGPEIEGMQGRQLRMRVLVLEPGGTVAVHSHKDRPEVAYVLQGTPTEYRGGNVIQYRSGDTWTAGKDTTHALENKGTEPVTVIVADVFRP